MFFSSYEFASRKILGDKPSCTIQVPKRVRGNPKTRYGSYQEALDQLKQFNKRGKCPWEPYVCFDCWCWHLGTPNKKARARTAQKQTNAEQFGLDVIELGLRVAKQLHNENNPAIRYYVITGLRNRNWKPFDGV